MDNSFLRGTVWYLVCTVLSGVILYGLCVDGYAAGDVRADALEAVVAERIEVGGFWSAQYKRITEKWLPHCIEQMEEGGRGQELVNLINAAKVLKGQEHGKYTGTPWADAYVYNTMEAICMALAVDAGQDAPDSSRRALS